MTYFGEVNELSSLLDRLATVPVDPQTAPLPWTQPGVCLVACDDKRGKYASAGGGSGNHHLGCQAGNGDPDSDHSSLCDHESGVAVLMEDHLHHQSAGSWADAAPPRSPALVGERRAPSVGTWVPNRALVGRESELAALKTALDEAVAGHGSLVLIGGEPGIGKTRLAEETAAHAQSLGVRALWANCWEGSGAPAFWPWMQVLRELLRDKTDGSSRLGSEGEPYTTDVPDLARLLPELVERVTDPTLALGQAPSLPPDQARFRLFDSIARLLVSTSVR